MMWYRDPTGDSDTNFYDCTLDNYKLMPYCGTFMVCASHGASGKHLAVYAEDTPQGQSACDAWRGAESNMTTKHYSGHYAVEVSSNWLSTNWSSVTNSNRTITMWSICNSASSNPGTGEAAVKEAAGGRWRFGIQGDHD